MPTLSAKRTAFLASEAYTDCMCVRIEKADGEILRFTTALTDLVMSTKWDASLSPQTTALSPNVTYKSDSGYSATALASSVNLAIDNIDFAAIYDLDTFTKVELMWNQFDGSEIYIFLTDYTDPVEDEHPLKKCTRGELTLRANDFSLEFRSLKQYLSQQVGRRVSEYDDYSEQADDHDYITAPATWQQSTAYTATDDYDYAVGSRVSPLADNMFWYKCTTAGTSGGSPAPVFPTTHGDTVTDNTVVWEAYFAHSQTGTVTGVDSATNQEEFEDTKFSTAPTPAFAQERGYWTTGKVTWTSGNNNGLSMEIRDFVLEGSPQKATFYLFLPMPQAIQVGDTYTLQIGYDRTASVAQSKFGDIRDFRGFPFVPGPNKARKVGGQA